CSAKKPLIDRIRGLVDPAVSQRVDEFPEGGQVLVRHLNANQNASVIGALIAVVKQADVPVRMHAGEEPHERAGTFGKLEAVDPFVLAKTASSPHHVSQMLLRKLVVDQVQRLETLPCERAADVRGFAAAADRQSDQDM